MKQQVALPKSWVQTTVGELFQIFSGGTPSTEVPEYWDGSIPWITSADIGGPKAISPRKMISEIGLENSATHMVPKNSIIVVTRVGLGKVALAPFDLCFSQDAQGLVFSEQSIHPEYAVYYLSTVVQSFKYNNRGTTISGVTKAQLEELPFILPSYCEQHRIVAKIEELFSKLDAGVAALERAKANLKRYRASVLKAAVVGKLTEQWRADQTNQEPASELLERILDERRRKWEGEQLANYKAKGQKPPKDWRFKYKEPAQPDTSNLPELPEGWCWATLSQIGILDRGKSRHRPRNAPHLYGGPYPFVQTGDVKHADTFIRTYTQTYSEAGLQQSRLWPAGTLCITIAANIAETAILDFEGCFPDSVVGFLPAHEKISTRFVELYLRTLQENLEALAPATAQKNINLDVLNQVAVCLPPYDEQQKIVEYVDEKLSVAAAVLEQVQDNLFRTSRLRQSILKAAFEGKLVPQVPNDESAEKLLERIREERVRQAGNGKKANTKPKRKTNKKQTGLPLDGGTSK